MTVLDAEQVRRLYDRRARSYDFLTLGFTTLGFEKCRKTMIAVMRIPAGASVVDLCCGTGRNFALLASAVGPTGRIIGVDLSGEMLRIAQKRADSLDVANIELIRADVREYEFPSRVSGVVSTFGLEMVPNYAQVVSHAANALDTNGRIGLLGLKHPEGWPEWLIRLGVAITKPFGVSRDYEEYRPWRAAAGHFRELAFKEHLFGAAYSYVGEVESEK